MEPPAPTRARQRLLYDVAVPLALVLGTSLLYAGVANHSFLHWDDQDYVSENPHVLQGLSLRAVAWAFTTTWAGNWHPLTWLSHLLDVQLFGPSPGAHHLVNAALHALGALLLYRALTRLTRAAGPSALVAALFAVHPLNVESVAWLAERKNLLSALFWFATLWAYARYVERPGGRRYLAVAALFALSLLAKPMMVTGPLLLLLLDLWPLRRAERAGRLVAEKLPLLLLSAASSAVTVLAARGSHALAGYAALGLGARAGNAALSYAFYLWKAVLPTGLAAYYPHPGAPPAWAALGCAAALLALTAAACGWAARSRAPWFTTGWLWFAGSLVPMSGVVQAGSQARADHYAYVPLVGIFVIAAWGGRALLDHRLVPVPVLAGAAAGLLALLGTLSWGQLGFWKDQETLFRHALAVTEENARAHELLGLELRRQGRAEEALSELREAARGGPNEPIGWYNLGEQALEMGRLDEAEAALRTALRLDPGRARAWQALGLVEQGAGRPEAALADLREGARLEPGSAQAWTALAIACQRAGRSGEAEAAFRAAVRAAPGDPAARRNLGVFLELRARDGG